MSEINTVSYDQFEDIPSLGHKSKIIFSENVYKYLNSLINETRNSNSERGCYLVGRNSITEDGALCFYFDFCTSRFQTTSGNYANGGVVPTNSNKLELINELEKYHAAGVSACIMHFHTHNLNGLFSSFSDQDYGVYATMKHRLKGEVFGMLGAPNSRTQNETTELCILNCRDPKVVNSRGCASFYSIPNIYYCKGNEIYKVGSFSKNRSYNKTIVTEISRSDRFVQNYREWQGTNLVSGIGINPNTNTLIVDENIGYIDVNHKMNFPAENLSLEFPSINQNVANMSIY